MKELERITAARGLLVDIQNNWLLQKKHRSLVEEMCKVLKSFIKEFEDLAGKEPGLPDCDHATWCGYCCGRFHYFDKWMKIAALAQQQTKNDPNDKFAAMVAATADPDIKLTIENNNGLLTGILTDSSAKKKE